jgi:hypothetical protein
MRKSAFVTATWLAAARCLLAADPVEQVVFQDEFKDQLKPGWSWLREDAADHRLAPQGGLEIHVRPGDANSVKSALVRTAPDRSAGQYAIEVTVTNLRPPRQQYEQAGITWYREGQPALKLVKELVDSQLVIIPGRKAMTNDTVQLRLVVDGDCYVAQFRPDGKGEFQTAEAGKLPAGKSEQLSIQCYHGPTDAEHWIRFEKFRIVKLESNH